MPLRHVTPFARTPLYFFTACIAKRRSLLANSGALACLTELWTRSAEVDGWRVGRFVLMPDHVHLFASPSPNAKGRVVWLKLWKSVSARSLIKETGATAPVWQPDTFDHILRSAQSYGAKWDYVRNNPVRKGLVETPTDWPWQGEIHSLAF